MTNGVYLHYDENVDHLIIYKDDEQITSTIDTGLVLVGLNKKKEIVGLEFMGAHKNFNISLNLLGALTGCIVDIKYIPEAHFVRITVMLKHKEEESSLTHTSSNVHLGNAPLNEQFACSSV